MHTRAATISPTSQQLMPWRPLAFWSLNWQLQPERMRADVRRMAEVGWGGCFLHARGGLATSYMSESWMQNLDAAIDECARLGMQAWLYDEDRWPSGMGGGAVVLRDPALRMHQVSERAEAAAVGEVLLCANGKAYCLERLSTDRTWAPDILDPEATQVFIDSVYAPYAQRYGAHFGGKIAGIFMDEPNISQQFQDVPTPAIGWSRRLREKFQLTWGYDLVPHLPLLFHPGPGSGRVRYHYRRLIDELLVSSFIAPLATWCQAHGLPFTGHMTCEESLYSQVVYGGSVMDALEHLDVPGLDMLGRKTDELISVLQASSVGRQCDRPRVQSELFGLAGSGASPADLRWIADWHLALGINQFCLHIANHSLVGARKYDCPPNLFHQQPWYPAWKGLSEHLARASAALASGPTVVDVVVVHPIESAWATIEQDDGRSGHFPHMQYSIESLQYGFYQLLENLVGIQATPDLVSESRLARDARADAGLLTVGSATYRLAILPMMSDIRESTVAILERFVAAGGTVLAVGSLPTRCAGEDAPALTARLARIVISLANTRTALRQALVAKLPPGLSLRGEHPRVMLRWARSADGFTALLVNNDRLAAHEVELHIPTSLGAGAVGVGDIAELDTADGTLRHIGAVPMSDGTVVRLTLSPGTSRMITTAVPTDSERRLPRGKAMALPSAPWALALRSPNALPLERLRYRLSPEQAWSEPLTPRAIQSRLQASWHRGAVFVSASFDNALPAKTPVDVMVECGTHHVMSINGHVLAPGSERGFWLDVDFPRFPIGHLLQPGKNHIEVAIDFVRPNVDSPLGMPRHPGTEIEPIILLGAFAVPLLSAAEAAPTDPDADLAGLPDPRVRICRPANRLESLPTHVGGDLITEGLPRFAGIAELRRTFVWQPGQPTDLDLASLACASVAVTVNGCAVGSIDHAPWSIDLAAVVRPGINVLELAIANTLRNHFMMMGGVDGYDLNERCYGYLATTAFMDRRRQRPAVIPPPLADGQLVLSRFGWCS